MTCKHCGGQGSWYGLAPHNHNLKKTGSMIGSTEIEPKEKWPDNYIDTDDGAGIWNCEHCNGSGIKEKLEPYKDNECAHRNRFELKGVLTCKDCSSTYNEELIRWENNNAI